MKWYENAVFYHIYPLGLTDAPKNNDYQITEHRLNQLGPWIKPVSYTHLDVYKRQLIYWSRRK